MTEFSKLDSTNYGIFDEKYCVEVLLICQELIAHHTHRKIGKLSPTKTININKKSSSSNHTSDIRIKKILSLKEILQRGIYDVRHEEIAEKIILNHMLLYLKRKFYFF